MTETDLQNMIRLALQEHGITTFRINVIGSYSKDGRYIPPSVPNGFSDLFGCTPTGRAIFLEIKTPDEYKRLSSRLDRNKPTQHDKDQVNFIIKMREQGAIASFCSSVEEALRLVGVQ